VIATCSFQYIHFRYFVLTFAGLSPYQHLITCWLISRVIPHMPKSKLEASHPAPRDGFIDQLPSQTLEHTHNGGYGTL
jgi:hypothetical protein